MRWPWRREEAPEPARGDRPAAAPPGPAGWAFLPPLQRTADAQAPSTLGGGFIGSIPTRVDPSLMGSMGHLLEADAPAGTVAADTGSLGQPVATAQPAELALRTPEPVASRAERRHGPVGVQRSATDASGWPSRAGATDASAAGASVVDASAAGASVVDASAAGASVADVVPAVGLGTGAADAESPAARPESVAAEPMPLAGGDLGPGESDGAGTASTADLPVAARPEPEAESEWEWESRSEPQASPRGEPMGLASAGPADEAPVQRSTLGEDVLGGSDGSAGAADASSSTPSASRTSADGLPVPRRLGLGAPLPSVQRGTTAHRDEPSRGGLGPSGVSGARHDPAGPVGAAVQRSTVDPVAGLMPGEATGPDSSGARVESSIDVPATGRVEGADAESSIVPDGSTAPLLGDRPTGSALAEASAAPDRAGADPVAPGPTLPVQRASLPSSDERLGTASVAGAAPAADEGAEASVFGAPDAASDRAGRERGDGDGAAASTESAPAAIAPPAMPGSPSLPLVASRAIEPAIGAPIGVAPRGSGDRRAPSAPVVVARVVAPGVPSPEARPSGGTSARPDGATDPSGGGAVAQRSTDQTASRGAAEPQRPTASAADPTRHGLLAAVQRWNPFGTAIPARPANVPSGLDTVAALPTRPASADGLPGADDLPIPSSMPPLPQVPQGVPELPPMPDVPAPPSLPGMPSAQGGLDALGGLPARLPLAQGAAQAARSGVGGGLATIGDAAEGGVDAAEHALGEASGTASQLAAGGAAAATGATGAAGGALGTIAGAAGGGPAAPGAPTSQTEVEQLAARLYAPLVRRLKSELLLDRERRGIRIDGL
ncbi:hypothetical protein ACWKWP_14035 [Agromyces soli]